MFKKLISVTLALLLLLISCASAATITVTGSGEVTAQPDLVYISVTVNSMKPTLQ